MREDISQNGDKSKTVQSKMATFQKGACRCFDVSPFWICHRFGYNQNGDKSKTATILLNLHRTLIQNAMLTCIQNGDTPKRRQIQNGDTVKIKLDFIRRTILSIHILALTKYFCTFYQVNYLSSFFGGTFT